MPCTANVARAHHTLVHDGGWTIHGNPDHELTFRSPFGIHHWTNRPDPTRSEVTQILDGGDEGVGDDGLGDERFSDDPIGDRTSARGGGGP